MNGLGSGEVRERMNAVRVLWREKRLGQSAEAEAASFANSHVFKRFRSYPDFILPATPHGEAIDPANTPQDKKKPNRTKVVLIFRNVFYPI